MNFKAIKTIASIFLSSILAGATIGIGGWAYLSVGGIIGSALFSIGLITIMIKGYTLYTGRIGFLSQPNEMPYFLIVLIGNLIGVSIVGLILRASTTIDTTLIIEAKLALNYRQIFYRSMLCGILMYLGTTCANLTQKPIYAMPFVMVFILCGAEHCIANTFYIVASQSYTSATLNFLAMNILGNTIGGISWRYIESLIIELSKEESKNEV